MIYRMKKNATGLASICILSTMVLVVVSTTVSMYAGVEDEMKYRYPNDITIEKIYRFSEVDNIEGMDESNEDFREIILNTVAKTGIQVKHFRAYEECTITTTYEMVNIIISDIMEMMILMSFMSYQLRIMKILPEKRLNLIVTKYTYTAPIRK